MKKYFFYSFIIVIGSIGCKTSRSICGEYHTTNNDRGTLLLNCDSSYVYESKIHLLDEVSIGIWKATKKGLQLLPDTSFNKRRILVKERYYLPNLDTTYLCIMPMKIIEGAIGEVKIFHKTGVVEKRFSNKVTLKYQNLAIDSIQIKYQGVEFSNIVIKNQTYNEYNIYLDADNLIIADLTKQKHFIKNKGIVIVKNRKHYLLVLK